MERSGITSGRVGVYPDFKREPHRKPFPKPRPGTCPALCGIQAPGFSQSFNRYAYVWNNPLKYTDPDGEWVHLVVGAVVGGVVNWVAHGAEFTWEGLGYFGVGAVGGALGAGVEAGVSVAVSGAGTFGAGFLGTTTAVGTGAATGVVSGAAAGFTGSFITTLGNELIEGNNFGDAYSSAFESGLYGALFGGTIGGILGGIDAMLDDRCFWTGSTLHEQRYVTDGEKLIHVNDWERARSETKLKFLNNIDETMDTPFTISIEIPKVFEPLGHAREGYIVFTQIETKNYSHFIIDGVIDNAAIGAQIRQYTRVINQQIRFGQKYFHYMGREKSFIWKLFIF